MSVIIRISNYMYICIVHIVLVCWYSIKAPLVMSDGSNNSYEKQSKGCGGFNTIDTVDLAWPLPLLKIQ